jgi:hypothetical protein
MDKIILSLILLLSWTVVEAQQKTWAYSFVNKTAPVLSQISSIAKMGDGGFVVGGYNTIFQLDQSGEVGWSKAFPIPYDETYEITSMQRTSDNGFIVSAHTGFVYRGSGIKIFKLDSQGDRIWQSVTPIPDEGYYLIYAIRQTKDGGYIFAGSYLPFDPGRPTLLKSSVSTMLLVGKLGGHGKQQWVKKFNVASPTSIDQTSDGGFIVATEQGSLLKLNSQGNVVWQKKFTNGWLYVSKTFDSGFVITGNLERSGIVLKMNSLGESQWQNRYNSGRELNFRTIAQTRDKGYIIAGSSGRYATVRALIVKLGPTGDIIWQRNYGHQGYNHHATAVLQTNDGGYILGTKNGWVLKTDSSGNLPNVCSNIVGNTSIHSMALNLPPDNRSPNRLKTNASFTISSEHSPIDEETLRQSVCN